MSLPDGTKNYSLAITAAIVGVAMIICTLVLSSAFNNFTSSKNTVTVTGAAKKQITSDLIVWQGSFSVQSAQLPEAYNKLNQDQAKVKTYLQQKGIPDKDIVFSSINTMPINKVEEKGMKTNIIEGYRLFQTVEVKSDQVDKIAEISRTSTELINQGVQFQSQPPRYFYTKLNDLKIDMLGEASKDARKRAEKLAENSGGKIGELRSSKMGVFQITPLYSNEISDYGINDTSSKEKEITAVVSVDFYVK